jgi:hypothetical protein
MSRRIDIEITSLKGDVATWRAAGAKLPKGVLDASLVAGGPVVGNVYRADIEQYMEGIEVLSIMAPKSASPLDPRHERLELIPTAKQGPDVIVTYAPKGRGRRDDRHEGEGRREGAKRPSRGPSSAERPSAARHERTPRSEGAEGAPRTPRAPRDENAERPPRPERTARPPRGPRGDSSDAATRPPRAPRSDSNDGAPRAARGPRTDADRGPRKDSDRGPRSDSDRGLRPDRGPRPERSARPSRPGRDRPSGPTQPPMTTTHRNAFLAGLSPEQLPVAEQLLRGGMPAVRAAVAEQNRNATAQGRPTVDPLTIDRIAEDLLGRTTLALWKDRASGAAGAGRELRLRDLRAVVTSAKTVSLDEDARAQLKELQAALTTRLETLRTQWNERLEGAISTKNVPEALRLVATPPDMSTRVSAEVAAKVVALTSEALTADLDIAKWKEIVSLAAETSIRRNVKPQGIPADESCKMLAVKNAGAIPEFAKLLGMRVPPPPPPTRTPRRPATRRAS